MPVRAGTDSVKSDRKFSYSAIIPVTRGLKFCRPREIPRGGNGRQVLIGPTTDSGGKAKKAKLGVHFVPTTGHGCRLGLNDLRWARAAACHWLFVRVKDLRPLRESRVRPLGGGDAVLRRGEHFD